ncbi:hypothetical protein BGZ63DRAFT_386943 [Mariannaea sp. PMI_226]|nr:hypothetical protein BGZ63DRAFT_386943 [Mariannaea sp. PMI_226]
MLASDDIELRSLVLARAVSRGLFSWFINFYFYFFFSFSYFLLLLPSPYSPVSCTLLVDFYFSSSSLVLDIYISFFVRKHPETMERPVVFSPLHWRPPVRFLSNNFTAWSRKRWQSLAL